MGTLWQDVRYGLRTLLKSPGFTAVAVLALALGIGVNSAIFSVVDAVLLRPLPFANPDQLVTLWGEIRSQGDLRDPFSYPDFADLKTQTRTLEHVAAYAQSGVTLSGEDEPERLRGVVASADLFALLGARPALGRTYTPQEDAPGAAPVVVISDGLWQRRFGSDPKVVGRQVTLNGRSATVLGVMPPGFNFPVRSVQQDLWMPLAPSAAERKLIDQRGNHYINVAARLRPGVTLAQAREELKAFGARQEEQFQSTNAGYGFRAVSMHDDVTGDLRPALFVLLGAVGCVLLIACANVANLTLARAATRGKEMAIRTALGASRWRIVRQLLTESVLLALVGGVLGLLLAMWGVDLLVAASPADIPRVKEIGLDSHVVIFTLGVSVLTGVLFGLAPVFGVSKGELNESLKEGGRGSTEAGRNRVRSALVVAEVALSLVLLIAAGLLLKSFMHLRGVDPGFNPKNLVAATLSLPNAKYPEPERVANFYREVVGRVEALPGVESAGVVFTLPMGGSNRNSTFTVDGQPAPMPGQEPSANYRVITPNYFRLMGIPLKRGRAFAEHDSKDAPPVIVVNESFARRYFGQEDPTTKRISIDGSDMGGREVVGVVGDVRYAGLDAEVEPEFYVPYQQSPERNMTLVVRAQSDNLTGLTAAIRGAVREADKDQPVSSIRSMDELLADSIARQRFQMTLLAVFAVVALLLAVVGIYGVMSYTVTQRTHEIGIRMALGAQSSDVLKLVVGQGMTLTLAGVGLGVVVSLGLTQLMSTLLFGVSATDPLTFLSVTLLLVGVAFLSCYLPARRASKVDPMVALRYE